jgi:hypothetical protein
VEGIEDDHPLLDRHVEIVESSLFVGASAEDSQVGVGHSFLRRQWSPLWSRALSSSVNAGSGEVATVMEPSGARATTLFTVPHRVSSLVG